MVEEWSEEMVTADRMVASLYKNFTLTFSYCSGVIDMSHKHPGSSGAISASPFLHILSLEILCPQNKNQLEKKRRNKLFSFKI